MKLVDHSLHSFSVQLLLLNDKIQYKILLINK